MKIRLSVPVEKKAPVGEALARHGIEVGEDAEYTLIETPRSRDFLYVRDKEGGALRLSADQIVYQPSGYCLFRRLTVSFMALTADSGSRIVTPSPREMTQPRNCSLTTTSTRT